MTRSVAVIDLGFGDSGKGILVARICATEDIKAVIRFSGGCQAAHNVVTDDGRHHTFSQFGSGTFSGVPTYLSKYMLVEPFSLMREAEELEELGINNPMSLVTVAGESYMTTPYHWELNRWREDSRGDGRHGSTGRGVGATAEYASKRPYFAPQVMDLMMLSRLADKLSALRNWVLEQGVPEEKLPGVMELVDRYDLVRDHIRIAGFDYIDELLEDRCVFEGSQGVLLDEDYGFFPHVTYAHTTDENVWKLILQAGAEDPEIVGVTRAYTTRHGFGPFVAEDDSLDIPELHNETHRWMGSWRVGHLDIPALQYSVRACIRVDGLYVTHLDSIQNEPAAGICLGYKYANGGTEWESGIVPIDSQDFEARRSHSERLSAAVGLSYPWPSDSPAETISEMLRVPLWGTGSGPRISQGTGIKVKELA